MAKFRGAVLSCKTCGKEFKVPPVRRDTAKYCSPACAGVGRGKDRELPKAEIVCKACGVTFFEHTCHAYRRTYCSMECRNTHSEYLQKLSARSSGSGNGMWNGGIAKHSDGYVYEKAPAHPFSNRDYVLQHRLVMERHLREYYPVSKCLVKIAGQVYLDPTYCVHHRDLDKANNTLENLQVLTYSEHQKIHAAMRREKKGDTP